MVEIHRECVQSPNFYMLLMNSSLQIPCMPTQCRLNKTDFQTGICLCGPLVCPSNVAQTFMVKVEKMGPRR